MNSRNAMAQYRAVHSRGTVIDASPTRLIQLMLERILVQCRVARGCMQRIATARTVHDVTEKGDAVFKVNALLAELTGCLDMDKGGDIATNLRALYTYMMTRLTLANLTNDPEIVDEITRLVTEIKSGWDQLVTSAA
jgi:flagellar secretion chaperone FliS